MPATLAATTCGPLARLPRRAAPPARGHCSSRAVGALRSVRQVLRVQAAQEGASVEASADGAGGAAEQQHQQQQVMPMSDSLIERAKLVVDTAFVDDSFRDTFVPELEAEMAVLRARAAQAEASAVQLEASLLVRVAADLEVKDKFVRLQADFENFRKRTAGEKESLRSAVRGDTVAELLPLVDNFDLAKKQLKPETEGELKIEAAYQGLYKQMVELFRGLGLEATPGVGSPFDPSLHDGIMREASEDVPDGTVLEEFRKGFTLGGKLLRPAMVKVSYSDAPAAPAAAAAADAAADEAAAEGAEAAASDSE